MSVYNQIAWLPLCGGLTGLGLVLSFLAWRRRGAAAGLRGAAWSLLPLAAYLIGVVQLLWRIGVAIASFAGSFVINPRVWAGVIVVAVSVVLFVVSGRLRGRRKKVTKPDGKPAAAGTGQRAAVTQPAKGKAVAPAGDDDLGDVADILRKHGIR
ncbi:MAG: cellulose synthase [Nocardiopsaceae bacterium]|jgi:membrane protein implicated in regulation of membrane protease activity|nr:cellulose synthase [Nocardiopsaceae bacterium]